MKTLGLRVKSGFAIAIAASGDERAWTILSRHEVPLTDGTDSYARFPFHPTLEMKSDLAARLATSSAVASIRAVTTSAATSSAGCAEAQLRAEVDRHGKGLVTPWRAEEKLASLGAYWQLVAARH
jgi:hypothetical protein